MSTDTKPLEDTKRPSVNTEVKTRWAHGERDVHPDYPSSPNKGKECDRYKRPIYTDPGKVPGVCRSYGCSNGEWYRNGRVIREKGSKNIVKELP
jgi:hypothetical protein